MEPSGIEQEASSVKNLSSQDKKEIAYNAASLDEAFKKYELEKDRLKEIIYPFILLRLKDIINDGKLLASYFKTCREHDLISPEFIQKLVTKCKDYDIPIKDNWLLEGGIEAIGYVGNYFNLDLAEFLRSQVEHEQYVTIVLKALREIDNDLKGAVSAQEALDFCLEHPRLKEIKNKTDLDLAKLDEVRQEVISKSESLAKLAANIKALEVNKRHPLKELSNLRDDYQKMSKEYKKAITSQGELLQQTLKHNKM